MSFGNTLRELPRAAKLALIGGAVLLLTGLGTGSWLISLAGIGLLIGVAWSVRSQGQATTEPEPWPWPADFRAAAERMARPIDPTPERTLPPLENTKIIAHVALTDHELSRLLTDKPPAWPWAVFTSVLVQRRNAVQTRLRTVASGYQPYPGLPPLDGREYCDTAYQAMNVINDTVTQIEQFLLSPAFTGAFGETGRGATGEPDPDAILQVAHRLMDYYEVLLVQAESCLQTPVRPEVRVFVQDMGSFTLCPLIGYEHFIPTMCARVGQAQDLLPYTTADTIVALDNATLSMTVPDGLTDRIVAHMNRFTQ